MFEDIIFKNYMNEESWLKLHYGHIMKKYEPKLVEAYNANDNKLKKELQDECIQEIRNCIIDNYERVNHVFTLRRYNMKNV